MKQIWFWIVCFACTSPAAMAQKDIIKSLERDVAGQGKVSIHQDARITALIGSHAGNATISTSADGLQRILKTTGYRVQVYAGNNTRTAKQAAQQQAQKVKELFPELTVYATFAPPRWLCRVGDYRSIEEADAIMRKLRSSGQFKEASIVRDQIIIPL
ncbi:MAG: SPOR domain-containing protein [Bacteroides sp.]